MSARTLPPTHRLALEALSFADALNSIRCAVLHLERIDHPALRGGEEAVRIRLAAPDLIATLGNLAAKLATVAA